ncbi:MAG: hypothetical protein IJQ56_01000, partial [Synergistaceae bacterium]|nr:hypothetical protein [Synergistaceae bacterium]
SLFMIYTPPVLFTMALYQVWYNLLHEGPGGGYRGRFTKGILPCRNLVSIMRKQSRRTRMRAVKRLLLLIVILFTVLDWLISFVLKVLTLWDRLLARPGNLSSK